MTENKIQIMIVDDSAVVRGLIARALEAEPDMQVMLTANNGEQALFMLERARPDIVILDIEMPVMDGIEALPRILQLVPGVKVIMASTLTLRNADISLKALALGATDYLAKPTTRDTSGALENFYRELLQKIRALCPGKVRAFSAAAPSAPHTLVASTPPAFVHPSPLPPAMHATTVVPHKEPTYPTIAPEAIAIGSSTGGPQALLALFEALKGHMPHQPIFLTQHMPPTFTTLLAQRIGEASGRPCKEAVDGEVVQPDHLYLAPGDYHLLVRRDGIGTVRTYLDQGPQENFCRPAVDPMLRSLVDVYHGRLLTVILTGMGSDGLQGARKAVAAGGTVVAQDEVTSVVWGMPGAVARDNLCSAILPLSRVAEYVTRACGGRHGH